MKFPFFSSTGPSGKRRSGGSPAFTSLDIAAMTGVQPVQGIRKQEQPFITEPQWTRDEPQMEAPPPGTIGDILVSARRINANDARRIVATQLENHAPFGETGIQLGLITRDDVQYALSRQFSMPCLQEGDNSIDPEVIAAFHPGHQLVERLRNLRGQISLRGLPTLLVVQIVLGLQQRCRVDRVRTKEGDLRAVVRAAAEGAPLRWVAVESADELDALTALAGRAGLGRGDRPPIEVLPIQRSSEATTSLARTPARSRTPSLRRSALAASRPNRACVLASPSMRKASTAIGAGSRSRRASNWLMCSINCCWCGNPVSRSVA